MGAAGRVDKTNCRQSGSLIFLNPYVVADMSEGSGRRLEFEELPLSLRLFLKVEALRRGADPEALLGEILAGGNPLPAHVSELIRAVLREHRWVVKHTA
jgi:hypothetical protein